MSARHRLQACLEERLDGLVTRVELAPLAGRRVFITGGTGFVGTWLLQAVSALNRRGAEIQVSALTRDPTAFALRQPDLSRAGWLTLVAGDVANFVAPPMPVDLAIFGAAPVTPAALANTAATRRTIVNGTRRALAWSEACGARRVLCLSSGAVYGEQQSGAPAPAESSPCRPQAGDTYAEAKLAMETLALAHGRRAGIDVVIARLFAFSGAWLPAHLAVSQLLRMALAGHPIRLQSDGSPVRSYLDGADLALWLLAIAANAPGDTLCNVGSDEALSMAHLAQRIRHLCGVPGEPILGNAPAGPRQRYLPDTRFARDRFGLEQWTSLDTSLAEQAAWLRVADEVRHD